jgi:hypothetical protein
MRGGMHTSRSIVNGIYQEAVQAGIQTGAGQLVSLKKWRDDVSDQRRGRVQA